MDYNERAELKTLLTNVLDEDTKAEYAMGRDEVKTAYQRQVEMGKNLYALGQRVDLLIADVRVECPDFDMWMSDQEADDGE